MRAIGLVVLVMVVAACGGTEIDPEDADNSWFVTTDPYGRGFACLVVTNGDYAGGGLFCTPKP